MNTDNKLKFDIRMVTSAISVIALLLTWYNLNVSANLNLYIYQTAASDILKISGLQITTYSVLGVFLWIIPILMLLLLFIPQLKPLRKLLYVGLPALGIIFTIIQSLTIYDKIMQSGSTGINISSLASFNFSLTWATGPWLTLVAYFATLLLTLLIDWKLKPKDLTNKLTMAKCPECGNPISKGDKFCMKCGKRFEEA